MCEEQRDKKSGGRAGPIMMQRMVAWHVGSAWRSRSQSACEKRATESANCGSSTSPRVANFVGAVGVSPGMDGSRSRRVSISSAGSRSDGNVRGDRRGGEGRVSAVDGVGRGRGTRGGVLTRRADGRGAPPGPKP